jgi:hypothetical protein
MVSNPSKNILSSGLNNNEAIKDLECWEYVLDEELKSEVRANSDKGPLFETEVNCIKLMIEAGLDKEQLLKFAENFSIKYELSDIQRETITVS